MGKKTSPPRSPGSASVNKELSTLVEVLTAKCGETGDTLIKDEEKGENDQMMLKKLFFSTREMKDKFKYFWDVIYVNKRLVQTRFKWAITMIYGVNSHG